MILSNGSAPARCGVKVLKAADEVENQEAMKALPF
jgi:hypothetical protein